MLTAGADIEVSYSYLPIPESATWPAAGIALVGLAFRFFQRGRSKAN
jgi:hypothetical protein